MMLDATVADGRTIVATLSDQQGYGVISPGSTIELPHAVQDTFASILDFARDCMDVADVASRREMLRYGDQLEELITELRSSRFCLCMAVRQTAITNKSWSDPTPLDVGIVYLVAAPADTPPAKIVVPRKLGCASL